MSKIIFQKQGVSTGVDSKEIKMTKKQIEVSIGLVHELPIDLKEALISDSEILEKWNKLTPIARNEWICWTISVKKEETRVNHIKRVCSELKEGKKRPCCWPGCSHR